MVPELKTLVRLFVEMGSLDEAHAVASALTVFGAADPDEQSLYRQYRPNGVVRAHARMTEEVWLKQVYHPEEDRTLSQILATLSPAVASARAQPAKELGLKRKHRRELATGSSTITKVLAYGAAVLGALPPEVYVVPDALGEIDVFNVRGVLPGTPALVVGQGLMQGRSDVELAFIVGRTLASIRPDHLLRWPRFVPTVGELEIVVRAAIRLYTPNSVVPAELASAVGQYAAFLERTLSPQAAEQLKVLVRRFDSAAMAEGPPTGGRLDLLRWSRAACLTTIRAGLLLAGDLEVALRLGQIPAAAAGIEIGDLVRDLGAWSVSEGYAELRTQLGLRTVQLGLRG
jgi:hypothetical protein